MFNSKSCSETPTFNTTSQFVLPSSEEVICNRYPLIPEEKKEGFQLQFIFEFQKLYHHLTYIRNFTWIRDKRVVKGLNYIYANYQENIFLKDAADHVGLSPSSLSKLLTQYTSRGFTEILNEIRIARTIKLIWESNDSLECIAYDCGFNTRHTFTREFKLNTGFTPSDFKAICDKLNKAGYNHLMCMAKV